MLGRFSIYDFIAVLIPGIFLLWAVGTLAEVSALQSAVPLSGGFTETSVLIVLGYVTGLMLQGISQQMTERALIWWWGGFPAARWLLPEDARCSRKYKEELAAALLKKFGIVLEREPAAQEPREIDEGGDPARLLDFGDEVQREGRFPRGLGAKDLGDPAPRDAADAQRRVERDGTRRMDRL
jgi:hypothetical protein